MKTAAHTALLLAMAMGACGGDTPVGPDGSPGAFDAAPTTIDAAHIDAATPPIFDAAPSPDAIPGFICSAPIELLPGGSALGSSSDYVNTTSGSCSVGSQSAKDVLYRVPLPSTPTDLIARVTVDEDASSPFDAVVFIQTTCGDETTEVACSDFGLGESVEALGLTDEAIVVVDGTTQFGGAPDGSYQLDVTTRSIEPELASCDPQGLASRCDTGLLCASGQCQTESAALACSEAVPIVAGIVYQAQTHAFQGDLFQGSCAFDTNSGAGEALFAFTLTATSNVEITTDLPGTDFDTVIYLRSACEGEELACADDIDPGSSNFRSRLQASALPAGDYLVVVDGASAAAPNGRVSLRLSVDSP